MSNLHERGDEYLERALWASVKSETITLSIRGSTDNSFTTISNVTAYRRVMDDETAAIYGGHATQDSIVWRIQVSTITAGVKIAPGCKITDSEGVVWIVPVDTPGSVKLQQWNRSWRCIAIKAVS